MNEQDTLILLHTIAWPTILALLVIFRKHKPLPTLLAHHILWFTNRGSWIAYNFNT